MIEYKFYQWDAFEDGDIDYKVKIEKPYEYLSMIFEGRETSNYVQTLVDGIQSVIDGAPDSSYGIENQQGFMGYAFAAGPTEAEYPEGGFQVFDFFTIDEKGDTKLMFVISLSEISKLLKDFHQFLKAYGR